MTASAHQRPDERLREWERRIPALLTGGGVLVFLWIVISAIGQGYQPTDDALRHSAYAVSGKTWSEILVLNPALMADHNPGWHVILRSLHKLWGWNALQLVLFSVAGLFLCVTIPPLFFLRRPEMWLGSLAALLVAEPQLLMRLMLGRPLLLSIAVFIFLMFFWTRDDLSARHQKLRIILSVLFIALAVWIHGTWYLFFLPALAFGFAGRWAVALRLTACWLGGSFLGACFTGHPVEFLVAAVRFALSAFGGHPPQHVLVSEFQAMNGMFPVVMLLLVVAVIRTWLAGRLPPLFRDPVFVMVILGWLLGLKVGRFWLDWGLPAAWVWLAQSFMEMAEHRVISSSWRRFRLGVFALLSLLFLGLNDYESRWSSARKIDYLSPDKKELDCWLPGDGGISYSPEMVVFYQTFFKNPQAPWRYMVGYEPALMPPEDLKVLRNIQWNDGDPRTYFPWLEKMRPEDRLVFIGGVRLEPDLPGIEWIYAATDRWIGRPIQTPAPLKPQP